MRSLFGMALLVLSGILPVAQDRLASSWSVDQRILSSSAAQLGKAPMRVVLRRLRSRPAVAEAGIGEDERTITVTFRDGLDSVIVPRVQGQMPRRRHWRPDVRVANPVQAEGRTALVLEPFAEEMGLGSSAGDGEAGALRSAGMTVDELKDGEVTLAELGAMSRYDVVYMQTHIGVNQWGEAVVVSAQPADGDPSLAPMIQNHQVYVAGIWGSTQLYYGILSGYVSAQMQRFRPGSILILNGCGLLKASLFWGALRARGAGALVSWDGDSLIPDEAVVGSRMVDDLASGMTVAGAVDDIQRAGLSISRPADLPAASFGYLGDGSLTLAGGSESSALAPTPASVAAPIPTPTPASTVISPIRRHVCAWLSRWGHGLPHCAGNFP